MEAEFGLCVLWTLFVNVVALEAGLKMLQLCCRFKNEIFLKCMYIGDEAFKAELLIYDQWAGYLLYIQGGSLWTDLWEAA